MEVFETYIPMDRRQALAHDVPLPDRDEGAALFADISGFTPLAEALARSLGPRRGAEELTAHLNSVYQALIQEVDRYRGSVIAFAGDAITCWFSKDNGHLATCCALAMQSTMKQFAEAKLANGETVSLAVKVGIAAGPARRFLVGNPEIQVLDVLAGQTLNRMAGAAHHAARGEVILDEGVTSSLGSDIESAGWKISAETQQKFAIVVGSRAEVEASAWPQITPLDAIGARRWLLRPVYERLRAGQGEFLTELRPAVALFLKFEGLDYDEDEEAGLKLSAYVSWLQEELARYEGFLVDVSIGDKGSYLYACFGAPVAHENDAWRAFTVANEIIQSSHKFSFISTARIGISGGTMRTGAYGGSTRRTYGVLGDEVNLAARLMEHAGPGQILVSERVHRVAHSGFRWQSFPPIKAKGKSEPIRVYALLGAEGRAGPRLLEPQYALPMVGRTAELSRIQQKLESVLKGQGQLLSISAEAGIGKSRLVAEAMRLARERGLKCFAGECQSHGTNIRYLVWQTIWQGLTQIDVQADLPHQIASLEEWLAYINPSLIPRLPLLGAVLNLTIPDNELTGPLEARLKKVSLEALLVECLRKISKTEPLLLVLEDIHWIDALSQDLLDVLARTIAQARIFLIVTQRPLEPENAQRQSFRQLTHFTEIALNAFTDAEAARLISLKLEQLFEFEGPPPPVLVGRLVARSAGNPFYLEELLNFLKDQNTNFEKPEDVSALELPASLHSLVLSRIDRLTENQQAALKVASVIGRIFPAAVVWGIQNRTEKELVAADLERLREADLTALERPEPELVYIFKHVVTQEVTYESLPHSTRSKLHTEIGTSLEQLYADRLEQQIDLLAFHFDRGLNLSKKREYLQRAGEAAQAHYANAAAVSYFERVLQLLTPAESIGVLLKLGKVWELTGDWKKAGVCYQQSYEAALKMQDLAAQARSQSATGDLLRKQGLYSEATDWLNVARTGFEDIHDQAGVGQTLHAAGTVAAMQGNYEQAQILYEQSLTIRRELGDKSQIASLLSNLGIITRFHGKYEGARQLAEQSLELRRQIGDRWAIANSLNNLGVLLRDIGEHAQARVLLEESLALNRQVGDRWAIANTLSSLAEVALDQKDWQAAKRFLEESLNINLDLGDRTAVAFALECFAAMAAGQAKTEEALRLAGAASALRTSIGSPLSPAEQKRLDDYLQVARQSVEGDRQMALFQQGSAMELEEALAVAVGV